MPTIDAHSNISSEAEGAPPVPSFGASHSVSWAGTALPLTACAAIWGIGDAAPAQVAWLTIAHGVIGTIAFAWTILQLALRWRSPRAAKAIASRPKPKLVAIYALLVLQPLLAIASSMLHGDHATIFGVPVPSVLPMDPHAALQVDRLHGGNALLLLTLIALHVRDALRGSSSSERPISLPDRIAGPDRLPPLGRGL